MDLRVRSEPGRVQAGVGGAAEDGPRAVRWTPPRASWARRRSVGGTGHVLFGRRRPLQRRSMDRVDVSACGGRCAASGVLAEGGDREAPPKQGGTA